MSLDGLRRLLTPGALLDGADETKCCAYDAAVRGAQPLAVVLARSAQDVVETVRWCLARKVPYTARGAGTNLCGGAVARPGGLVLSLARLDRVLEIDTGRGFALVEPGVVNLALQRRLEPLGYYYAPDPASHRVCTIGGNIGENAGGPRCLKYGVTANHVLALEAVLPDGSLERLSLEDAGPEIASLLIGSEGTLAVVTKAWLRITRAPEAVHTLLAGFDSLEAAMECVGAVIASGVVPRSLESLDRATIESVDRYKDSGYPKTEAVLLIELDGTRGEVARDAELVAGVCLRCGAGECRSAGEASERERLWEGRRAAYPAMTRLAPNVLVEDGVVPRDRLPEAVRRVRAIAGRRRVRTALVFHAGDGNLHPNVSYDERDLDESRRVREAGQEMLKAFVELGGTVSGEHGIGVEKRAAMGWMFEPAALDLFRRLKAAFDPEGLANPGKLIPEGEAGAFVESRRRPLSPAAAHLAGRVRECGAARRGMLVRGSGSRLPAAVPGAEDLAPIVTAGLGAVLDLDRRNGTVTAEAGISVHGLHLELASQGFHLRLPKTGGTLGGLLATKPWPGIRDDLLGLRIALPDGTVLDFGGKIVKNVAGYDVPRLLLGSWGTLAVILDATFKVYARPVPGLPASVPPKPFEAGRDSPWRRRVKQAFDPANLLNPWLG